MNKKRQNIDVPIRSAVIAWQPSWSRRSTGDASAGDVGVFRFLDPGERSYLMTHGACWCDWADQSVSDLVDALQWLKSVMVRDYGISLVAVERAFNRIPEYRHHQADNDEIPQSRGSRKAGFSIGTR